jgi:Holliday junction resolvase
VTGLPKMSNFRRSRGYSYEHSLVQRLNNGEWCARRLGGSSAGLPDIVAVNNKKSVLLSIEAKSGTGDALYIPQDQIRRCILIQNMFGYYKRRYTIFAFKFMKKKRYRRRGQTVYEPRKLVEYYKSIENTENIEAISMIKCTYDGKTFEFRNEQFVESNLPEFPMPFTLSASRNLGPSSISATLMNGIPRKR